MVATVHQLFQNQETIEGFVNRERVVSTTAVEYRFGLSNKDARTRLRALADAGKIKCAGLRGTDWGAAHQWESIT